MTCCVIANCTNPPLAKGFCRRHYDQIRNARATYRHGAKFSVEDALAFLGVASKAETDACIDWPWSKSEKEYGRLERGRRGKRVRALAHRAMCYLTSGPPPFPEADAAHHCGRPCCVNPRHVRWATRSENMADRWKHGTAPHGEKAHGAKLTDEKVREIRKTAKHWPVRALAARYGVSMATINGVLRGETWRHVV